MRTNAFELLITDPLQLAGLPDMAVAAARQSAQSKGLDGWRFTLHEPSYVPLMTYMDDRDIRERVFRAHTTRASKGERNNEPLMARILELRREKATLLGYRHFADFTTEDRMAHTGDRAREFLLELERQTRPAFEREKQSLAEFRVTLEGPGAPALEPWDIGYYAESSVECSTTSIRRRCGRISRWSA